MTRARPDLEPYRTKRRFEKTREPAPRRRHSTSSRLFVVQKHRARQLHYDFRLEAGGVLKSWSVPKGPSLDPSVKRLAVTVEDHPVDYADFEGIIPEGEYGGGTVMVWDRGTYRVGKGTDIATGLRRGELTFTLQGRKLKGGWSLVHLRGRNWLLIKRRDRYASAKDITLTAPTSVLTGRALAQIAADEGGDVAKAASGDPPKKVRRSMIKLIRPMLATLVPDPFHRRGWVYEEKYDGIRALAYRRRRRVRLYSRSLKDITPEFPEIARALEGLAGGDVVVDGEIVAVDRHGVSRFQLLQRRTLDEEVHPAFAIFDCLERSGVELLRRPLAERRRALEAIVPSRRGILMRARRLPANGLIAYRLAQKHGWEGVIGKDDASPYEPGRRSRSWLKVKCRKEAEFVIGGFTTPRGQRKYFGALLVGLFDGPALRFVGKVGAGFSRATLADLSTRMRGLRTDESPFRPAPREAGVTWVRPELVAQIAFAEWTADGKLRQPVFRGLRHDKKPSECTWSAREL